MTCATKNVALDVHQANTSASVRGGSGRVLARTILPMTEPALVGFFRGMRGAVHVAVEEGGPRRRGRTILWQRFAA